MTFTKTKKKSTAAKKSKPSTPKRKLAAVSAPASILLDRDELSQLNGVVEDLRYIKSNHSKQITTLKIAQAELALAKAQAEKAEHMVKEAVEVATRIETGFEEALKRKTSIIADICEKRGIAPQELEYNNDTGEVINLQN